MSKEKVFLYARTSTGGQELGIYKQLSKMREHSDSQGYEIVEEYSRHISGMKKITTALTESKNDTYSMPHIELSERPVLRDVYIDCQLNDIDKVLVHDPSRLARRMRTELILEHLFDEIGVEIEYLEVSDSWIGKQISTLINEYEVRQTRKRTKQALEQKADDEWKGRPPTGFKTIEEHNKLEVEPWLEQCVSAIKTWRNSDKSRREIAEDTAYEEITPSRMTTVQKNIDKDKPKPKYVKGERPY